MISFDSGVSWLPAVAIALSISGAGALLAIGRFLPRIVRDLFATAVSAAVATLAAIVLAWTARGRVVAWSGGWVPHHGVTVGILLESDSVGAGIGLLSAVLMTAALLYSWRYFEDVHAHYHALMLLFLAGMVGFAFTGDLFDMFVFFELMGAAAYALTGMVVEDATAMQGSLNFAVINSLGAYFALSGLGLLYARTGALGLASIGESLAHSRPDALVVAAFVLVLTGFLVKAAMVPFHFWLADAHAVAPPSVCVLFSGVMVPLGAYAALRVYWVVFSATLPAGDVRRALLTLGVLTAVLGAVMAVGQRHVKRLLAYSTVAHVGLFLCGLGLLDRSGTAGIVLYVGGHAMAKAALFLLAGILLVRYGTVDEHALHGRGQRRGALRWLWVVGALALSGAPPFGPGLGKAVVEEAAAAAGYPWLVAVFVLVSGVAGGAVLRATGRIYFGIGPPPPLEEDAEQTSGDEESQQERLQRVPFTMYLPIVLLLAASLAEGVLPGAHAAAEHAASWFVHPVGYREAALQRRSLPAPAPSPGDWTGLGFGLAAASTVVAFVVAALGCYAPALAERAARAAALGSRGFAVLRRLHSGHVGDYVAWLMAGVVALAALVGLPLVGR